MPFLDAARRAFLSAREFARDVLINVGNDSTETLQGNTEEVLEHEINNESLRVVKGDGTECQTTSAQEPSSDDDTSGPESKGTETFDEEPSWVTPHASPPTSEDENENRNADKIGSSSGSSAEKPNSNRTPTISSPQPSRASARRNSTAAIIDPAPAALPSRRRSTTQMAYSHSKDVSATPSVSSPRSPLSSRAPTRQSSREFQHHHPHHQHRMSTLSMSSSSGTAPRPSIRRSHASHPDISSLCQQWANSGPANQTLTYKPESTQGSLRRKSSMTSSTTPSSPVLSKKALP